MRKNVVVETINRFEYPDKATLFRPNILYPEYPFSEISELDNRVYDCVRNAFKRMQYDKEHFGMSVWNPLGEFIHPGNTVLIKPNFVEDENRSGATVECLYTQPGVIAPVIDYVVIALKGQGKIIVADAPMQDCNFEKLIEQSGLAALIDYYKRKEITIELKDFRVVETKTVNGIFHYVEKDSPSIVVDLADESEFTLLNEEQLHRLRKGANDVDDLRKHQNTTVHEYDICKDLLEADVLIDMPKPKLHKKAGVTISLKNMIGVNVRKEYLPHYMEGDGESGTGDAYPRRSILKSLRNYAHSRELTYSVNQKYAAAKGMAYVRQFFGLGIRLFVKDKTNEGKWHGNHTISKTVVDINKIVKYADKYGVIQHTQQRKRLIVADMIIAGEKMGPLAPTPKNVGIIAVGEDPVCFDECIARLMGAYLEQIPTLVNSRNIVGNCNLSEKDSFGVIISNRMEWNNKTIHEIKDEDTLGFVPVPSWKDAFIAGKNE